MIVLREHIEDYKTLYVVIYYDLVSIDLNR